MRKFIGILMISAMMVFGSGCALLGGGEEGTVEVLNPIPSEQYIAQVQPLIDALVVIVGPQLDEDERAILGAVIENLREQSLANDEVYILPALVASARPLLESELTGAGSGIDPEEALLALVGLNLVNQQYGGESPLVDALYPILSRILQEAIDSGLTEPTV